MCSSWFVELTAIADLIASLFVAEWVESCWQSSMTSELDSMMSAESE